MVSSVVYDAVGYFNDCVSLQEERMRWMDNNSDD